jgi:hypothetical protein
MRARAALRPRVGADVAAALDEQAAAILDDLGGPSNVSRLAADLVARYAELEAIASGLVAQILESSALTPRGRARAVLGAYLQVTGQQLAIARQLGLQRRPADLTTISPAEWARQHANQQTGDTQSD